MESALQISNNECRVSSYVRMHPRLNDLAFNLDLRAANKLDCLKQ